MRNQVFKKLFSALLALIMVAGLLPASVLAEGWGEITPNAETTPAATAEPTAEPAETTEPTDEPVETAEPTAEPAEGEEPAEPVQEETPAPEDGILLAAENVTARDTSKDDFYRIVHLDCGREYFSKDWIIALINEMAAAGYNQLQLAFGNGGFRFYLNDMSVDTYLSDAVKEALEYGNTQYNTYGDNGKKDSEWKEYNPTTNALTESEMDDIIAYAKTKSIEIVPMLNTPGHMNALLHAMSELGIGEYSNLIVSSGCMDLSVNAAVNFTEKLVEKYIEYFHKHGCKFFNLAMDEYYDSDGKTPNFTSEFFTYANKLIGKVISAGMTPRVFNDALTSSNKGSGSFTDGTQVCCWDSANVNGYSLINTSHDFYYVSTNENWNLNKEGYTFVGDYNDEATWVKHAENFSNHIFKYKGNTTSISPVGSMFCIWCNTPGKNDETTIAQQIRMILRVIGARMQDDKTEYADSSVLVDGGFKADGTINVTVSADKVYSGTGTTKESTDKKDEVIVSAVGLKTLTATKVTENLPAIEGAAKSKIVAYDVTPYTDTENKTKHTGEATVSIAIPEGWDTDKVRGFVVNSGDSAKGNIKIIDDGKVEDGYYTFTAPHFSVMGIYEEAVTYEDGGEITIPVGETRTLTIEGGATTIGEVSDSSIATKSGQQNVSGGEYIKEITSEADLKDSAKYLIQSSRQKGTLTSTSSTYNRNVTGLKLEGSVSVDNTNVWTITYKNGTATIKNSNGKYLTIGNDSASVEQQAADLMLQSNVTSTSSGTNFTGWTISQNGYYLNHFGGQGSVTAAGWKSNVEDASKDAGSIWQIYEIAERPASTEITFEGKKAGDTSIVIDGKIYKIKVVDKTLAETVLPINLWITNTGVVPTGWGTSYNSISKEGFTYNLDDANTALWANFRAIYNLSAAMNGVNSEQGAKLSDLLPQSGMAYGRRGSTTPEYFNVNIWKCSYNLPTERQSTDGWSNNSNKGTIFEYIRYYENKWEYSADGTAWKEITNVGAEKTDTDKNQICVWFRQVTTVTTEVTTEIVDWGPIEYKAGQSLLDFAVKYDGIYNADGTPKDREPDSFPVTGKTIGFDCPTKDENATGNDYVVEDSDGSYYRVVYGIAGVETANYEVYMITVTPSSDTHTININSGTAAPTSYKYNGTEKIAWAKTEQDANISELEKASNIKFGNEPFLDSVKIYQYQGLLVTYYLRAKKTDTSLTVHYAIEGSNEAFYEYNIAVDGQTVTQFDPDIKLNEDQKKGPLKNGTVVNSDGRTITVSSDLSTLDGLEPQYRYSEYEVVRSDRKDDKNVWIYYTFTRKHTYVIDFGIPLNIKFSDFGVTETSDINSVSFAKDSVVTEKTGLYGTAKVITDANNKYVKYELNKPLDQNVTIPLYVTFKTKGNETATLYTANIIPATTVYYEDSFATFTAGSYVDGESNRKEIEWGIEGTSTEANATQALEALGDKKNVYGYDDAYKDSTMFSMGSARKVTVTNDMVTNWTDTSTWPTAQFTFKGTGFDIISLTDNTSGAIFVDVYKGKEATGNRFKSYMVDNYYGYKKDGDNWVVDKESTNALYQIPVMQVRNLTYGEYTAVVTVFYDKAFNHTAKSEYSFWLDAVRVYDPAGTDLDNEYVKDKEGFPQYIKLRDELAKTENTTVNVKSMVFIDGGSTADIATYANIGPNNEVYLANGQAITFKLNIGNAQIETVQIGAKSPNSNGTKNANMVIGSITQNLNTATEMYYDITTEVVTDGNAKVVTITNTGDAILSLTNLKITYTEKDNKVSLDEVSVDQQAKAVETVRALFAPAPVDPEPEPEPEKTFEPERFEASWTKNVMQGRKATLTVKTSEDVEAITVDGQTIRSYRTRTERVGFGRRAKRITYREFTYSMVAQKSADFSVTAINAEGTESEATTARLTVQKRPSSVRDVWNWFKGWF